MAITLCGLLYVGDADEQPENLPRGAGDPIEIYMANAILLARSAQAVGNHFVLTTNDKSRLDAICQRMGAEGVLDIREYAFVFEVKRGITWRSAHYKLELLQILASGAYGPMVALVDLDMVMLQPIVLPDTSRDGLWVYDLTQRYTAEFGEAAIRRDLAGLLGEGERDLRWFGGEFLMGRPQDFDALWARVSPLWQVYAANLDKFGHVGDETVLSAALCQMMADGYPVHDAGAAGYVSRWWSARSGTRWPSLRQAARASLLHLPADKHVLATQCAEPFDRDRVLNMIRQKVWRRRLPHIGVTILDMVKGRKRKYLPQLG